MTESRAIMISGRAYRKNPEVDRYQIHLDELGDLRMNEIPPHSHVEILGIPGPSGACELEVFGLNAGDEGEREYLEVYGGASFKVEADQRPRIVARLRRAFPQDPEAEGIFPNPHISTHRVPGGILANVHLNLKFKDEPETRVRDALNPFLEGFRRLDTPGVHAFICHASEDKAAARELAQSMKRLGADVWFDEWEIRVGDSIVQKIDQALGAVSHLIVLLSEKSIKRPWVQKELSSALIRQLSERSITVLPLRLDGCAIPPILADIRYADARAGMAHAVVEIEQALFANIDADETQGI